MTIDLGTISPVELAVALSMLPAELVAAAKVGLEVAALRADTSLDLDDVLDGRWHRNNVLHPLTELMRRRWPPTGDRDLWIRYGPAEPPEWPLQEAA